MSQSVLDTNVLILNRFYMAIRVVNVRRAFTLLYRECAEVIDNENGQYVSYDFASWCELSQLTSLEKQPGEDYIRAVGFELQVPRIVRLTRFDRMPQQRCDSTARICLPATITGASTVAAASRLTS